MSSFFCGALSYKNGGGTYTALRAVQSRGSMHRYALHYEYLVVISRCIMCSYSAATINIIVSRTDVLYWEYFVNRGSLLFLLLYHGYDIW